MDNYMIEKARAQFIRASEEFGFTFKKLLDSASTAKRVREWYSKND